MTKIERPIPGQPIPANATRVFEGKIFDVYQWEQEMFDGSTATFEKLKRLDTVVVVPTCAGGTILAIEDEQPGRKSIITFPGGRLEPNEEPDEAIRRELLEETGYQAGELVLWKAFHPVSKVDWVLYVFVARGCTKITEPHPDAGEKITIMPIQFDELFELMNNPKFQQGNDLKVELTEAKYNPEARAQLHKTFFG